MIPLLVALVVIPGSAGDILNAAGMKIEGEITDWSLRGMARVGRRLLRNVYILASIPVMAVSFFALLTLISATDLSFAVPVSATSYVVDAIFAKFLLREQVRWQRWAGICLVAIGIGLLSK